MTTLLVNSVTNAVIVHNASTIAHSGSDDTNCRLFPMAAAKPDFYEKQEYPACFILLMYSNVCGTERIIKPVT